MSCPPLCRCDEIASLEEQLDRVGPRSGLQVARLQVPLAEAQLHAPSTHEALEAAAAAEEALRESGRKGEAKVDHDAASVVLQHVARPWPAV
jgi:hypothetical protein